MTKELPYLTSLRGLCAGAVLVYHLGWFGAGQCGVLVFFLLSGYVLTWGHKRRARAAGHFLMARLRRTAPTHIVATLAVGLAMVAIGHDTAARVATDVALLPTVLDQGPPVNGPTWSLAVEWLAYLLFPIGVGAVLRRPVIATLVCAAGFVTAAHLFPHPGWGRSIPWGLCLFGFGGALAASGWEPRPSRWLAWIDAAPLRWLGDVSYPLYLIQMLPIAMLLSPDSTHGVATYSQGGAIIASTLALAAILHYFVESPARRVKAGVL